jgi:hypothetical protein
MIRGRSVAEGCYSSSEASAAIDVGARDESASDRPEPGQDRGERLIGRGGEVAVAN